MSKTVSPSVIIGAGLAGLIAGYAFPGVQIIEASPAGTSPHRALLRFRSDAVSRLTGIPFRRVRVNKGIWSRGEYCAPNPQLANLYSRKCLDMVRGDRSIWNIEPVDRWVGPADLVEQMTDALSGRIEFDEPMDFHELGRQFRNMGFADRVISTAPISRAAAALPDGGGAVLKDLTRAPIWVRRFEVDCADAHQTVYFPDHNTAVYRASITGSLLIIESRARAEGEGADEALEEEVRLVCSVMGLARDSLFDAGDDLPNGTVQRYGKIIPLPDETRRGVLARLTMEAGIYSLGRFATWRNILLDDVVQDVDVIRRMLRAPSSSSNFHALRASAGR